MNRSAALLLVAATFVSYASAATAEPYDLRGIQLGMTIEAFRAMPYPDQAEVDYDVKAICEGDPEASGLFELNTYGADGKAGVRKCNFYGYRARIDGFNLPPSWNEEGLRVATISSYMSYEFIPDALDSSTYRLFRIIVRTNIANWDTFYRGYTGKYGPPSGQTEDPIQNQGGATFDNVVAVWDSGDSTITLIKRFERVDTTFVFYEHTALSALVQQRLESVTGAPADSL